MTDVEKLQQQIKQEQDEMLKEFKQLNESNNTSSTVYQGCNSSCQVYCENCKQCGR